MLPEPSRGYARAALQERQRLLPYWNTLWWAANPNPNPNPNPSPTPNPNPNQVALHVHSPLLWWLRRDAAPLASTELAAALHMERGARGAT